jgi:hypothetical protein
MYPHNDNGYDDDYQDCLDHATATLDLDGNVIANDNGAELDPDQAEYDHDCDSDWSLDVLLLTAGYDPSFIPEDRRRLALSIAELWAGGVCTRPELEEALDDDSSAVRDTARALRKAARGRTVSR